MFASLPGVKTGSTTSSLLVPSIEFVNVTVTDFLSSLNSVDDTDSVEILNTPFAFSAVSKSVPLTALLNLTTT